MKRFKAESQGDAKIFWNVIDTKTSTYVKRLMPQREAVTLSKKLNKFSIRQLRNDIADYLYTLLHD